MHVQDLLLYIQNYTFNTVGDKVRKQLGKQWKRMKKNHDKLNAPREQVHIILPVCS